MEEKNKKSFALTIIFSLLLIALFFFIPIEHKYDKLFRFYSKTLIPANLGFIKNFDQKIFFYPSDILGLVFLFFGIWQIRKHYYERGAAFLSILFICAVISIVTSPLVNYPIAYIRLLQFLTPLSLFFFLAHNFLTKERLFNIWSVTFFSVSLIQSLFAIAQYFTQHSLGLRIIGEQTLGAVISVPHGHLWIFDHWFNRTSNGLIFRAMGTLPHPNALGSLLVIGLLITTYFFTFQKQRVWYALAYLVQLFALGTTYSRSAIFAFLIATAVWILWIWLRQKIFIKSTVLLVIFSVALVFTLLNEQFLYRGGLVNQTELSIASDQVRFFYQDIAFRMIEKHPFTGIGHRQFSIHAPNYLSPTTPPQDTATAVHNIYLLIAAETGLIALAAFLIWIGLLLFKAWRTKDFLVETGLLFSVFIGFLFIGGCDLFLLFFQQGALLFFGIAGMLARFGSTLITCKNDYNSI